MDTLIPFFKKQTYLLIGLIFTITSFGCSSSDDSTRLNTNLLYGQWYRVGLCQEQNSLLLNANKTYVSRGSGAIDCDDTAADTYEFTGTFTLPGNGIKYNQQSAELIIDGTDLSTLEFPNPDIVNEIVELTDTSLIIRSYINLENNVIQELGLETFEH
nr:hypothetical protein [uncultured Psychroserpens sp.]